jgi:hypothetical protein
MKTFDYKTCVLAIILLCALMNITLPVTAANGTFTITYRGLGSGYLGDTFVFDGKNTFSNTTIIRVTGPNLPLEGVPLSNLGGAPGSGNKIPVDSNGKWAFAWDTSSKDASNLQTARYTITASDGTNPEQKAKTSVVIRKPEFYMTVKPSSAHIGDYVEILGMAEKGVDYIKLEVSDISGNVVHTHSSPVSGTGSFQYGFHVDMSPGQYNILGTNPSMKNDLAAIIEVTSPQATGSISGMNITIQPTTLITPASTKAGETATVTTTIEGTPSKTGIASTTIILALCVFGTVMVFRSGIRKK